MANKSIDISTSHNIVVSFELASLIQRILAWFIDGIVIGIYSIFASIVSGGNTILLYILVFFVAAFYHLVFEILNKGQSLGKMAMKIRVVTLRGRTPTVNDYFMRWIFRMVDITFSLGTMAIFSIISSKKNQRVGDVISQTTVVLQKNENAVSLKSILDLDKKEEILYPTIKEFTDEDMLLLKQSLNRYRQFPNDNIKKILIDMSDIFADHLKIDLRKENRLRFLDRVLYEYIILTR